MTTNLHDKMLKAIDAYFSISDIVEQEAAENLLHDVRDELLKRLAQQQEPVQRYSPDGEGGMEVDSLGAWMKFTSPQAQQEATPKVNGINDLQQESAMQKATPQTQPRGEATLAREWVGLTDEEIKTMDVGVNSNSSFYAGALWAEAKLKEKNT